MAKTDLSSSSKPHVHTRVSLRKPLRCGFTIVLCSCLLFGATQCRAQATQDAAETARQEHTRKVQAKKQKHVYTDEDLRRAKILTPDDEAGVEAKHSQQPAPTEEQAQAPVDADTALAQLPLGDIARRYRNAKRAAQTPDPFHLPFEEPVFATPIISVPKLAPPRPNFSPAPSVAPARPNAVVAPAIPSPSPAPLRRIDPFTRRFASPAPPSVARIAPPAPRTKAPVSVAPSTQPATAASAIALPAPKSKVAAPPSTVTKASSPVHTVIIQRSDSLWKLAQQNLGRGSRWQELLAANPGIVDPTRIAAGTEIVIPTKVTSLNSDLKVTVERGDTLSRIAQATYGRVAAWRCIAQANPEIADADRIYEGQQLLLPFNCKQ
jgi:nucleoid-associated protein YgaU